MRVTKSVVFGLVSLVCIVKAIRVTDKPVLAKTQALVTGLEIICIATCDNLFLDDCEVECSDGFTTLPPVTSTITVTSTSTSTSTSRPTSTGISIVTVSTVTVTSTSRPTSTVTFTSTSTVTSISTSTPTPTAIYTTAMTTEAALNPRQEIVVTETRTIFGWVGPTLTSTVTKAALAPRTVVSITDDDCTAVCWDLMPGTECDVQCSSDFKTTMPGPSDVARVASIEAHENVQAQRVREIRLVHKFGGLVARDDAMTVNVTSIPGNGTNGPQNTSTVGGMLPIRVRQDAGAFVVSATTTEARTVYLNSPTPKSSVTTTTTADDTPTVYIISSTPNIATTETVVKSISTTKSAPKSSTTKTVKSTGSSQQISHVTTVTSNSSETFTPSSTTLTEQFSIHVINSTEKNSTSAAPECADRTWLVLSLLVGVTANAALLI